MAACTIAYIRASASPLPVGDRQAATAALPALTLQSVTASAPAGCGQSRAATHSVTQGTTRFRAARTVGLIPMFRFMVFFLSAFIKWLLLRDLISHDAIRK